MASLANTYAQQLASKLSTQKANGQNYKSSTGSWNQKRTQRGLNIAYRRPRRPSLTGGTPAPYTGPRF